MEIICNNELLVLSVKRAIFWPRKKILILADLHLGKTGYFRSKGIPIPSTILWDDLKRISILIQTYQPKEIIVAGDMFHHGYNSDIKIFRQWRQNHLGINIVLVPGNHDKQLPIEYDSLGIQVTPDVHMHDAFTIVHQLPKAPSMQSFFISGHIHPGYKMEGRARQSMRLPCFIVAKTYIVLPAFSAFTGLDTSQHEEEGYNYFLIAGEKIIQM